jgi:CelD/BcsL family acetyltransferase involved in cellulose biosynthesis
VTDAAVLATCLAWKADQYRRTKLPNLFAFRWVLALFDKLFSVRSDTFSTMMSVLYAGDRVVAINLSLRYRDVLHAWFPSYDRELAHYSPGTLLWFETMRASQELGIRRIELGKGPEKFKRRFMSGATAVSEGTVDVRPIPAAIRNAWQKTRHWIQTSPLNIPARAPAQLIYRCRSWLEYH